MKTFTFLFLTVLLKNIPRIIALLFLAALVLILLAGCRHDNAPVPDTYHSGTYRLVSVNGQPVPCALTHEGTAMTIHGGSMTFPGDGTCVSHMEFSVPQRDHLTKDMLATSERHDAKVTLRWQGAGITYGTFRDYTFSMDNEGMKLVYQK